GRKRTMSSTKWNRLAAPALAAVALWLGGSAEAQDYCVPRANGVPYDYVPPSWWAVGEASVDVDDPRWHGALAVGEQRALSDHDSAGMLRMLQRVEDDIQYVYLSLGVVADPTGQNLLGSDSDTVEIALNDGTNGYSL